MRRIDIAEEDVIGKEAGAHRQFGNRSAVDFPRSALGGASI